MKNAKRFAELPLLVALALGVCGYASAAVLTDLTVQRTQTVARDVQLQICDAHSEYGTQVLTTVEAGEGYAFAIGGKVGEKSLVADAAQQALADGTQAVAGINGDHFSFKTGIPLGMSMSQGRILTDPVEPQDDGYYADTLGITSDGTVLVGENLHLRMEYTLGGKTYEIDRINRTRETWDGGQLCLFTPDYGESTGTDGMGKELIIRLEDGEITPGKAIGTVIAVNGDNDSSLADGTVVLSAHMMRYDDVDAAVGDTVTFAFSFEEEAWNEVVFAVSGNSVIVKDGEPYMRTYQTEVFAEAQPRSAIGVRADGTLVMAAVDGRSEQSHGLTANEMGVLMAEQLDCTYALLLDGGGSTALCTVGEDGTFSNANTPSEQRPVGNCVLLVQTQQDGGPSALALTAAICGGVVVCAIAVGILTVYTAKRRTAGTEADGENAQ